MTDPPSLLLRDPTFVIQALPVLVPPLLAHHTASYSHNLSYEERMTSETRHVAQYSAWLILHPHKKILDKPPVGVHHIFVSPNQGSAPVCPFHGMSPYHSITMIILSQKGCQFLARRHQDLYSTVQCHPKEGSVRPPVELPILCAMVPGAERLRI
ncbi:hypothetical protein HOY80DRAFT_707408 [Tuber brumale]|nr:hypothetical protein HOY80DRAFT_707408 [Tuber brumale]